MARLWPLLGLLTVACDLTGLIDPGSSRDKSERGQKDTLIIGKAGDVIGLDPGRISDDESVEVCEQIYEHLVRYTPGSTTVEPDLATSWDVSDHGTVWTFHLRDGVRFHDGTPLDADAVVFSLERQRDPSHPYHKGDMSYWEDQYRYIEEPVQAVDRLTVRFRLQRPFAPFLSSLAMFPASIVSPTAVKKWGDDYDKHPVGTGPFRFSSWTPGDRIVLERNRDYWGPAARLERLVFRRIPDARQRLVALEGGAVDVAYSIMPEELQYVQLHPDLRLHQIAGQNVAYLAMNTSKPPFDDVLVRRAVNHAVNKVPIVKLVYQGQAEPASGPVPPSLWGFRKDVQTYPYDPGRARELLAEAQVQNPALDLTKRYTLYVSRTPRSYLPDPERVAHVIQRNLEEVGLKTDLVVQEFPAHLADVQSGKHDLCLLGWTGDNGDPDNFLYVLLDRDAMLPGPQQNVAFFRNGELHGVLRYAQETLDQDERIFYYQKAQEIVAREAPWVPLAWSELSVAARYDVEDLALQPSYNVYYARVWLDR